MMTGMAKHAIPGTEHKSSAKVAAWSVLVTMGGTSVTLNIWDATHSAHPLYGLIAVLKGLAPVLAAMLLSEAGARFDGGKVFRGVAFGIMGGAMVLSASAVASVLRPSYPAGWLGVAMSWLFGLVLDAAALTGLWIILTERERRREAERAEAEHDAGQELAGAVAAAEARVTQESAAAIEALRAAHAAELEQFRTDLATANATAQALREKAASARKSRRGSARKPAATSGRNQSLTSAPEPARTSAGSSAPEDMPDLDTEARILSLIAQGHSASEAGILAGKSDSYGRQVARLARAAKTEPAGNERADGDVQ